MYLYVFIIYIPLSHSQHTDVNLHIHTHAYHTHVRAQYATPNPLIYQLRGHILFVFFSVIQTVLPTGWTVLYALFPGQSIIIPERACLSYLNSKASLRNYLQKLCLLIGICECARLLGSGCQRLHKYQIPLSSFSKRQRQQSS